MVGRAVRDIVPPIALSYWRWVVALALLLPFAWPQLRRQWRALARAWRWMILLGVLSTGLYNALAYIGLNYTTATNGLLLNSFAPVLIVAIGWAFFGRRIGAREALGVALSLAGVLAIVSRGAPASLLALHFNAGDLWVLASVLSWSVYTCLLPHRPAEVAPLPLLVALIAVGLVAMAPAYAWELSSGRRIVPGVDAWAAIAYAGIFPAFFGYLFWNKGVEAVGPARAGLFMHLMPAFGIVLSMIFLGERPQPFHFVGIAGIFGGIWLTTRSTPA